MKTQSKLILATSIIISLASMYIAATKANASETIKVYSERQPFLIEPLINENTVGIIPVHIYGQPCEMREIMYF